MPVRVDISRTSASNVRHVASKSISYLNGDLSKVLHLDVYICGFRNKCIVDIASTASFVSTQYLNKIYQRAKIQSLPVTKQVGFAGDYSAIK